MILGLGRVVLEAARAPRASGDDPRFDSLIDMARVVLPARAGMIRLPGEEELIPNSFPRDRGFSELID